MTKRILPVALSLPFAIIAFSTMAMAGTVVLKADMDGIAEVPPNISTGAGQAMVTIDTEAKTATYTIVYSGLTDSPTAAHLHGPAMPGINAGVVAAIPVGPSPLTGTIKLTDAQITEILMGRYYINIHTQRFRDGEIRGDLTK